MIDYNRKLPNERGTHRMCILVLIETLIFIKKMLASVSCYFMYSIKIPQLAGPDSKLN